MKDYAALLQTQIARSQLMSGQLMTTLIWTLVKGLTRPSLSLLKWGLYLAWESPLVQ
uniref:Receptor-like protein 12 n=1 Tax=Rhizophora mucronata TaxID=61149 RepID=A0A2P2IIB3_RHIMU